MDRRAFIKGIIAVGAVGATAATVQAQAIGPADTPQVGGRVVFLQDARGQFQPLGILQSVHFYGDGIAEFMHWEDASPGLRVIPGPRRGTAVVALRGITVAQILSSPRTLL